MITTDPLYFRSRSAINLITNSIKHIQKCAVITMSTVLQQVCIYIYISCYDYFGFYVFLLKEISVFVYGNKWCLNVSISDTLIECKLSFYKRHNIDKLFRNF